MVFRTHRRKLGQKLAADTSGAAAVEFAFIAVSLVVLTFAILDVGFALYTFNRAEKATQLGVRVAAVSNPVSDFLPSFSGTTGPNAGNAGDSCGDATGAIQTFCAHPDITCTASSGNGACTTGNFSDPAFSKIFNEMRVLYPHLSSDNVQVEYRPTILGFAGRPGNAEGS
jgi:Flp pilus assembly protein TadG